MTAEDRIETALRIALAEHSSDIRAAYAKVQRQYGHTPKWQMPGAFDNMLARRYAKILAPRVAELLRGDA